MNFIISNKLDRLSFCLIYTNMQIFFEKVTYIGLQLDELDGYWTVLPDLINLKNSMSNDRDFCLAIPISTCIIHSKRRLLHMSYVNNKKNHKT